MEYRALIKNKIQKVIRDEITASIAYRLMANRTTNPNFQKEMEEHGDDEYRHFKQLVDFCMNHSCDVKIQLDNDVIDRIPDDNEGMFRLHQELEQKAMEDYFQIVLIAKNNNDFETEEFFKTLLQEEMEHFDDVAVLTGVPRDFLFK